MYVDHCARLSGAEIALSRLLPALAHHVDPLVLLGEDGPLVQRLQSLGVAVDVMPLDPRTRKVRKDDVSGARSSSVAALAVLPYTLGLARRLRSERADLVHTNSLKAALYGGAAGRLARVPVIWHVRDRIAADYLPRAAVRLVRAASRVLPTGLIANSSATLATLPRHRTAARADDPYAPTRRPSVRPAGPLVVGVVGRLSPWKGQHVFLEAFAAALGGTDARARLIGTAMFGEDDYAAHLQRRVVDLGLQRQVEFRGFQEDVERELSQMDILVHCSTSAEPFGQVVVEGMAAGLPVIAAAEGGPAEIIEDGVDGLLVPPRRPEALAAALRLLAHDSALRQRLGGAATRSALRYLPAIAAEPVLALYAEVTDRSRRR